MVRALLNNRCDVCRARKVKCDSRWPVCGPCQRGKRKCPGPPAQLRFVDNRPEGHRDERNVQASLEARDRGISEVALGATKFNRMVTVRSRKLRHGSFLDMRLEPAATQAAPLDLRRSPSMSDSESTIHSWMRCVTSAEASHQIFVESRTPRDLLIYRIGGHAALDASLNCIIKALTSMRQGKPIAEWIDMKLYCNATNHLRKALDNPKERLSIEILCTTLVLSRLESVFGAHDQLNYITHAGGMARMLSYRGPHSLDRTSLHLVLHACQGAVLGYSLAMRQDSIFCQPEWQAVFDDCETLHSGLELFMHRLHRHMAYWPLFAKQVAAFNSGEADIDTTNTLISRLKATLSILEELEIELTAHLHDQSWATEVKTPSPTSLTSTSYHFTNIAAAGAYSYHAMYNIVLNTMLASLSLSLSLANPPLTLPNPNLLIQQNLIHSHRIWKTNSYAQSLRPLAGEFLITPLMVSYDAAAAGAGSDSVTVEKILQALDSLVAYKGSGRRVFSRNTVLANATMATGRVRPDLEILRRVVEEEREGVGRR